MTGKRNGFTLIELLVVIAIIGVLSTVAITSLNGARAKARDARRKNDLNQILLAFEQYYMDNNTYLIADTGYLGTGTGYFNSEDDGGNYEKSIATGLREAGYFDEAPLDPSIQDIDARGQYMLYPCENDDGSINVGSIMLYAHLEMPSEEDLVEFDAVASSCPTEATTEPAYQMNYVVGHSD